MHAVEIKGLTFSFNRQTLFPDFYFALLKRYCTALLGRSGIGKSTLLRIIAGWDPIQQGNIQFSVQIKLAWLAQVRLSAVLPSLASGLRIAISLVPIGAVVGEWGGSSKGLNYLILQANARVDMMFVTLLVLLGITLSLYLNVDHLLHQFIP